MNFVLIRDFFRLVLEGQNKLEGYRKESEGHIGLNSYSLFRSVAGMERATLDKNGLIFFLRAYEPCINSSSPSLLLDGNKSYRLISTSASLSDQALLAFGVQLFLAEWGSRSKSGELEVTFEAFSHLLRGTPEFPRPTSEPKPSTKKWLMEIITSEIQFLLHLHSYKAALKAEFGQPGPLFKSLAANQKINSDSLRNLFLMFGQRLSSADIARIAMRIRLPWDEAQMSRVIGFDRQSAFQQIHYSNLIETNYISAEKPILDSEGEAKFHSSKKLTAKDQAMTPEPKSKPQKREYDSTMAKSPQQKKELQLKWKELAPQPEKNQLRQIIIQQEGIIRKKHNLILCEDCDLRMLFLQNIEFFKEGLQRKYGSSDFTAFVRYVVPEPYQYKYLAFTRDIRRNPSDTTRQKLMKILSQDIEKQQRIDTLWSNIDREMVFRSWCLPSETKFRTQQFHRYFTKREASILKERMDPNSVGYVTFDKFK